MLHQNIPAAHNVDAVAGDQPGEHIHIPSRPTYCFEAGKVYNVGTLELQTGQSAYLEEGSIVCGRIRSYMADDVSVTGNGILSPGAVKRRVCPSNSWEMPSDTGRITARSTGSDTRSTRR